MKRKMLLATILIVASLCVVSYSSQKNQENDSKVFLENVEALTERAEEGGSDGIICYYSSKVSIGYTYYDCGTCKKVYDEKGKGSYSKCF